MAEYPREWKRVTLGDVADIVRGGSPRPIQNWLTDSPDGVNWVKIGDVKEGAKYITSTAERIKPEGRLFSRDVYAGDFLLSNSMSFGRPYILKIDGCIHDGWLTIQNYSASFDQEFLYYLLSSDGVYEQYLRMAAGSSVKNLNKEKVAGVVCVMPPLPEQRRIAAALGDMDKLIENLGKRIAKKHLIKKGAMQELLTGKKRLPGFSGEVSTKPPMSSGGALGDRALPPPDWEQVSLVDTVDVLDNQRVPLNENQRKSGVYPYCGANGIVDYIDQYIFDDKLILIAEDGGNFQDFETRPIAYQMTGKFWVNNHAHVLKAKSDFYQDYIFYQLAHKDITDFISGGTRAKLTRGQLDKIKILLPPPAEQAAIARVLSDMDAEIASLERRQAKLKLIKKGMLQDLLTGKVRI